MITAVEDPGAVFFDNGFSIDDKKSPCGLDTT